MGRGVCNSLPVSTRDSSLGVGGVALVHMVAFTSK